MPRVSTEDSERPERKAKPSAGAKRSREENKGPLTLRDHIEDVKGHSLARFLTDDLTVIQELKSDDVEKAVETVDSSVTGLVVTGLWIRNFLTVWSGRDSPMLRQKISRE